MYRHLQQYCSYWNVCLHRDRTEPTYYQTVTKYRGARWRNSTVTVCSPLFQTHAFTHVDRIWLSVPLVVLLSDYLSVRSPFCVPAYLSVCMSVCPPSYCLPPFFNIPVAFGRPLVIQWSNPRLYHGAWNAPKRYISSPEIRQFTLPRIVRLH